MKLKLNILAPWCGDDLLGKDPNAGKLRAGGEGGPQEIRWLDSIADSMHMNLRANIGDSVRWVAL